MKDRANHMIDFSTEFGSRVTQQLKSELIIWLTTVDSRDNPQPRPVWFQWDGKSFLIYSRPNTHKLSHISQNPRVSINLNSDAKADEVAVFRGEARLDPSTPSVIENEEYKEKYESGIANLDMTPAEFSSDYSIPIRVTPSKLRGF